jgi:chemotaxis protein methyltransferase CheR
MLVAQANYQIDQADFELVRAVVYKHCGISLSEDKKALVQARITKQMRAGGFTSAKAYLQRVISNRAGKIFADFIDAISTNLTSFFREDQHFKYLLSTVLPAMLARKQLAGDGRILTWSAACSSGEEPYSMAITLLEAVNRQPSGSARWDIRILGTDISTRMLATARAGIYKESGLGAVPAACRSKYFTTVPSAAGEAPLVAVTPDLRELVRLRHLNLIDSWPFKGPFDFIFCRNVMIYFDKTTQETLIDRFWNCLQPGGLLFTGHSESLNGVSHRFLSCQPSIYQKPE